MREPVMGALKWERLYGSFYMGAYIWGSNQHGAGNSQHMETFIWELVYAIVYMGASMWELLRGSFYMGASMCELVQCVTNASPMRYQCVV